MYLETIYVLTEGGSLARTRDIAAEWKVSQPSATEMVQKLAAQGYLHYEPYKGASLTPQGMELGRAVIRKHRLLERFLVEIVRVPATEAEDPACEMEHVIPPPMEAWICELLGHPLHATLMMAWIVSLFWHVKLGVQVVLEDYVHLPWLETAAQLAVSFTCTLAALASLVAVGRIVFSA